MLSYLPWIIEAERIIRDTATELPLKASRSVINNRVYTNTYMYVPVIANRLYDVGDIRRHGVNELYRASLTDRVTSAVLGQRS